MNKHGKFSTPNDKSPPTVSKTNGGNGGYERRSAMNEGVKDALSTKKSAAFNVGGKWPRTPKT